jgi:hypothetical protein
MVMFEIRKQEKMMKIDDKIYGKMEQFKYSGKN